MQLIAEGSEDEDDSENHHNNTHPLGNSKDREKPDDVLRREAVEDFLVLLDTSEKKLLPEVPQPVPCPNTIFVISLCILNSHTAFPINSPPIIPK